MKQRARLPISDKAPEHFCKDRVEAGRELSSMVLGHNRMRRAENLTLVKESGAPTQCRNTQQKEQVDAKEKQDCRLWRGIPRTWISPLKLSTSVESKVKEPEMAQLGGQARPAKSLNSLPL